MAFPCVSAASLMFRVQLLPFAAPRLGRSAGVAPGLGPERRSPRRCGCGPARCRGYGGWRRRCKTWQLRRGTQQGAAASLQGIEHGATAGLSPIRQRGCKGRSLA